MNKSTNQFNHLKVLSIKTYDKLQSGFVLLVVLVVLLFISGLTALMMSQNSVDVRSVLYHQNQYKLFIAADKAVMNLWQLSPKHLVHMAQTDTWLASLLSDKNDLTKFIQLKAVMTGKHLVSVRLTIRQYNAITLHLL
ncbi:hypothetical protein [Moraxella catarrhalis]|uniref:hypothetical protein n=1 Tax=Moraxella catarrhalis TaxID=480 RepID=UPI000A4B9514|nr:hypothetical protein [Moraxella catarrhalis]